MRRYFCDWVELIELHPEMYVGERNLTLLKHLLTGINMALEPHERIPDVWENMHEWIRRELNFEELGYYAYDHSLLEFTGGDQKKATALFFILFRKYRVEMEMRFPATPQL
ncbi:MAG: hypothetical protein JNM62_09795 [Flavobacteriales bacterium]|nr:hypothetical protein [Flavobacteriales bacterium]